MVDASNLTDNPFLRQYELKVGGELATLEYSQQDRKIFLTKLNIPSFAHPSKLKITTLKWMM